MCAIQQGSLGGLANCDYEKFLNDCTGLVSADQVRSIVVLAFTAIAGKVGSAPIEAQIGLPFAVVDAEIQEGKIVVPDKTKAHDLLMSEQDVIKGIVSADYVRATSGAITIVEMVVRETCPDQKSCGDPVTDERADRKKVLAVLAAAGKYAATLKSTASPDDIQSQRAEIIKELVERTVSRTGRQHGVIVSLGGNLGLLGAARVTPEGDSQWALPVQLGLGVGLQTYHSPTVGFHAMLTALELGQYVVFNAGDLKVQTPEAASSVIIGLTLGVWTTSRETPFYIGPYGAVSPFVKTIDGSRATYQIGLAAGIYVPLFDFN